MVLINLLYIGTELNEAKEKLQRADSSSSDSEEEGVPKRKKIEAGDKPTEDVNTFFFLLYLLSNFELH